MKTTLQERFLRNIKWTEGFCPWIWQNISHSQGYGRLAMKCGEKWFVEYAHRVAYELFIGPIPIGMQVLHDCDNPSCVWPGHLKLGTQSENVKESYDKNRATQVGESNACHKLTEQEVREIKSSDKSGIDLAMKYGVSKGAISLVRSGKRWSHVS